MKITAMLREAFFLLIYKYTDDQQTATQLWKGLQEAYTDSERHFHNLAHLEQMHLALTPLQSQVEDWDTLAFAVLYHDVVYDVVQYVTENDNEDKSAGVAEKALQSINYPTEKIERCKTHILSTKHHKLSTDNDTNFLTDVDLMILGQPWQDYKTYMHNIRKEYDVYPDGVYNSGRSSALKGFLKMKPLFKTDHFRRLYERQARENIERELEILSLL